MTFTASTTFILVGILVVLIYLKKHHSMPVFFGLVAYLLGLFTHEIGINILHVIGKISSNAK